MLCAQSKYSEIINENLDQPSAHKAQLCSLKNKKIVAGPHYRQQTVKNPMSSVSRSQHHKAALVSLTRALTILSRMRNDKLLPAIALELQQVRAAFLS